jgi:hypothetical protein
MQSINNMKKEINRLKNYYAGTYRGRFGRTATLNQERIIKNLERNVEALIRQHTKARTGTRNELAKKVFSPNRVAKMTKMYMKNNKNPIAWLNHV